MKKSNTYLADDEKDLRDLIKKLLKEKILILFISITCGLLGYFYALLKPQVFETEIIFKNPPAQIFELYNLNKNNNKNNNNNNNNNNNSSIAEQFISNFKLNFLSLDNLQRFTEESSEFDNFKRYLKLRNISAKQYFRNKIGEAKDKNIIISNKYFINHPKELDGVIFLNKYVEFIKKKTIVELKNVLKLSFLNTIDNHQVALDIAKKIQQESPIANTMQQQVFNETETLFYLGAKALEENIIALKQKMIKLENDQFNYNIIYQEPLIFKKNVSMSSSLHFVFGLILGLFLSLGIIFFKSILKYN